MSSDKIVLSADKREVKGKKVRALREAGLLPANMYEKGNESVAIQMPFREMVKVWQNAGKNHPVELSVDGKKHLAMIKTVSYDPVKATLTHVSFHVINQNEAVEAEVPVKIEGDVPAVQQGNFIVRPNKDVIVKALPANLPSVLIALAVTLLEPGDSLKVSDLNVPENVEVLTDADLPIAIVEEPRAAEEPEVEEEVDPADVPSDNGGEDGDSSEDGEKSPGSKEENS